MARKVSKTAIGGFVLSAIAMLIAGVILFGSGQMFRKTDKYVMFFEKSVKGLSVGAPVVWQGVEVGSVEKIVLRASKDDLSINIPIVVAIDPTRYEVTDKGPRNLQQAVDALIERGLRAQLALQSIVTGQLMIELEFFPGTPVRLTGLEPEYIEIPTRTSSLDRFAKKLESLPIEAISQKLLEVLENVDKLTGSSDLMAAIHNLKLATQNANLLVEHADGLVTDTDTRAKTLSVGLAAAVGEARQVLEVIASNFNAVAGDARKLLKDTGGQIRPLSRKIEGTLDAAQQALKQAQNTLAGINGFVGERSDSRHKLNRSLDEIASAARSVQSLMDYLERHPEALLQGKGSK